MADTHLLMLVVYLLVLLLIVPNGEPIQVEEWLAVLWPVVVVVLIAAVLYALPFMGFGAAHDAWKKRRNAGDRLPGSSS